MQRAVTAFCRAAERAKRDLDPCACRHPSQKQPIQGCPVRGFVCQNGPNIATAPILARLSLDPHQGLQGVLRRGCFDTNTQCNHLGGTCESDKVFVHSRPIAVRASKRAVCGAQPAGTQQRTDRGEAPPGARASPGIVWTRYFRVTSHLGNDDGRRMEACPVFVHFNPQPDVPLGPNLTQQRNRRKLAPCLAIAEERGTRSDKGG